MTPQAHLGQMIGQPQGQQPDEGESAPDIGGMIQQLMLLAVQIARSAPATQAAMRQIIQAGQQAMVVARSGAQPSGGAPGPIAGPASPPAAGY